MRKISAARKTLEKLVKLGLSQETAYRYVFYVHTLEEKEVATLQRLLGRGAA